MAVAPPLNDPPPMNVLPMERVAASPPRRVRAIEPDLWRDRRGLWVLQSVALIAVSLLIWAFCLKAYANHNDTPAVYHPDESGKGEQLISDRRNFLHPQLMLEAALLVLPHTTPTNPNEASRPILPANADLAVRQTRVVSAAFGAGTAVLLAWAGWAAAGWTGFLCVGIATALCPALLSHAHFLKEDASLMFGIAVVLCAGAWAIRFRRPGPQLWAILFLGVGCGLAASGKYAGAVMIAPAAVVAFVAAASRGRFGLALASPLLIAVFAAATWAGVNYRVILNFDGFLEGFTYEKMHAESGHQGVTMHRPNGYFADLVWTEAMPHVKGLAYAATPAIVALLIFRRRRSVVPIACGFWLALAGGGYLIALSYSTLPFYRYAMPVTVTLYALAALVLAWFVMALPRGRVRFVGGAVAVCVIGVLQGVRCADYNWQFANDSRDALREWAWSQPEGTRVAADSYSAMQYTRPGGLPPAMQAVQYVRTLNAGPFSGRVADLKSLGVQYAITVGSSSERFLSPYAVPEHPGVARGMAFYKELQKYPVAWSRVAKNPMRTFANPDIIVYDITKPPTP